MFLPHFVTADGLDVWIVPSSVAYVSSVKGKTGCLVMFRPNYDDPESGLALRMSPAYVAGQIETALRHG